MVRLHKLFPIISICIICHLILCLVLNIELKSESETSSKLFPSITDNVREDTPSVDNSTLQPAIPFNLRSPPQNLGKDMMYAWKDISGWIFNVLEISEKIQWRTLQSNFGLEYRAVCNPNSALNFIYQSYKNRVSKSMISMKRMIESTFFTGVGQLVENDGNSSASKSSFHRYSTKQ